MTQPIPPMHFHSAHYCPSPTSPSKLIAPRPSSSLSPFFITAARNGMVRSHLRPLTLPHRSPLWVRSSAPTLLAASSAARKSAHSPITPTRACAPDKAISQSRADLCGPGSQTTPSTRRRFQNANTHKSSEISLTLVRSNPSEIPHYLISLSPHPHISPSSKFPPLLSLFTKR